MIKVENLFHDYEGKGKYAVNDVSFEIKKGEIFGFWDPAGPGKAPCRASRPVCSI
jgi:fluoroquinolone transport system ATP-binding protein